MIFEQRGPFLLEDLGSGNRELSIDDIKKYPKLSTRTYTIKENGFITVSFKIPNNINWYNFSEWIMFGTNIWGADRNDIIVNDTAFVDMYSFGNYTPVFKGDIITDYGIIDRFSGKKYTVAQNYMVRFALGQFSPEVKFYPFLKKNK